MNKIIVLLILLSACAPNISVNIVKDKMCFEGAIYSVDGKLSYEFNNQYALTDWKNVARHAAEKIKESDVAKIILSDIRSARYLKDVST